MKKYEYGVLECHMHDMVKELGEWGDDGWKVVHVEYLGIMREVTMEREADDS